ncbi:MAG: 4Fe-4S dicluster domain-containing protein [Desulfobacterales bacterium]|nr:MAG: 4Fe-4S dicluster domain-containing protein [Desulfobacterales bacterium]
MDWDYLVQHPLLGLVLGVCLVSVGWRTVCLGVALVKAVCQRDLRRQPLWRLISSAGGSSPVTVLQKTIGGLLRYIFHAGLIVVPIWYGGHIPLWEEYGFDWYWTALPDPWIDRLTILVLVLALYFGLRRICVRDLRRRSAVPDYVVITVTALPFVTGYLLTHGDLRAWPVLDAQMETLHVLTAEMMIALAAFLFCRIRIAADRCTGCASCGGACATGALRIADEGSRRLIRYAAHRCIRCGSCVRICPASAAELRHEISFRRLFQFAAPQPLCSVALHFCEQCGALVAPQPQVAQLVPDFLPDGASLCPKCSQRSAARKLLGRP